MRYLVLLLYFAVLFLIGGLASRRIHDLGDYFVGGKKLGYWVVAFSSRATGESAWLLLGLTGLGAMVGLSAMWVVVGEVAGVAIAWFLMAGRFKRLTDAYGSITIPDYLVSFFSGQSSRRTRTLLRTIAAGSLALFVTIYVSAQIDATGKAFESFLSWNYYTGVLVGFAIVVAYTFSGGFIAVAWSDLFQGLLMFIGLVAVPLFAFLAVPHGVGIWDSVSAIDPGLTRIWGSEGFSLIGVLTVVSYAAIGLGFLGSPQIFVRFMSLRHESELRQGRWVAVTYTLLTDAGAVLTGMFGRVLLTGEGVDPESVLGVGSESVLPLLVEWVFPVAIVGLYIAAVLAAIMSTIDSLLVVASSAVTRDFYQQVFHPDLGNEALTNRSRVTTLVLAAAALIIALAVAYLSPDRTVFWYVIFGWSGIAATFCPVIILTLFWPRYTVEGAIATMVTGMLSVPVFKFALPAMETYGHYFDRLGELAPAFVTAFLAGIVVSLLTGGSPRVSDSKGSGRAQ